MTEPPAEGWQHYARQVGEYLDYCARSRAELEAVGRALDRRYHPTADGAVKMIAHAGNLAEAEKIRQAFAELTGGLS